MKNLIRLLACNLIFLSLGIVTAELCFGNWIAADGMLSLNLLQGVEYRFDARRLYSNAPDTVRYRRDLYGLRGRYGDTHAIDILTVGGSATDQRYIDEEATWQAVLERRLREYGQAVSVVNAGVDGQSTYGHLKNFDLWFAQIPDLRARCVLLYVGGNDLFADPDVPNDDVAGTETMKGAIKSKSALYDLYRTTRGMYRAAFSFPIRHRRVDFDRIDWTAATLSQSSYDVLAMRFSAYAQRLRLLARKVQAFGAVPIFVTQPLRFYKETSDGPRGTTDNMTLDGLAINGMDCYRLMERIGAVTLQVCRETGGVCLDLAHDLAFTDDDFYDYFHNTPSGTAKIGTYLAEKLKGVL